MREAAKRAGVSERTVRRRWTDEKFRQRVLDVRGEIRWEVTGRLTTEMKKATAVLTQGMSAQSESVRLSAARLILKIGHEFNNISLQNAMINDKFAKFEAAFQKAISNQQT